jgi:membrane protein implicated in regulation of membrane protease activity
MVLTGTYLIMLLGGMLWAVLMGMMSGLHMFDGGHDGDVGADHAGADAAGGGGAFHFSPLSPINIATFVTGFGGMGLITLHGFHLGAAASLALSLPAGTLFSFSTYFLMYIVFIRSESSSESQITTLVGEEAEVLEEIPATGIGQIAYISMGSRFTGMAQSADGTPIPRGAGVRIKRVIGSTFIVEKER